MAIYSKDFEQNNEHNENNNTVKEKEPIIPCVLNHNSKKDHAIFTDKKHFKREMAKQG